MIEAKMWLGKCLEAKGSELPAQYRDNCEDGKEDVPQCEPEEVKKEWRQLKVNGSVLVAET